MSSSKRPYHSRKQALKKSPPQSRLARILHRIMNISLWQLLVGVFGAGITIGSFIYNLTPEARFKVKHAVFCRLPGSNFDSLCSDEFWLKKAGSAAAEQDYAREKSYLDRAIAINPGKASHYNDRGLAQLQLKHVDEAERDYLDAIARDPSFSRPYFNLGNIYSSKGEYARAKEWYDKALSKEDFAAARLNRAYAELQLNLYDQAIADSESPIKLKLPLGYFVRGTAYNLLNKYTLAVSDFEEATRHDFDTPELHLNKAIALRMLGQKLEALDELKIAQRGAPNLDSIYFQCGLIYNSINDVDAARANFEDATRYNPKNAEAFSQLALIDGARSDYSRALSEDNEALKIEPNNPDYLRRRAIDLGFALSTVQDRKQAFQDLGKLRGLAPNDIYTKLAEDFIHNNTSQSTLDFDLEKAEKEKPQDENIRIMSCAYFSNTNRFDKADADCDAALDINPESIDALSMKCIISFKRGDDDLSRCEKAVSSSPNNSITLSMYAFGLLKHKKLPEAVGAATKALDNNGSECVALVARSLARTLLNELDLAVDDAELAVKCNSQLSLSYYARGTAKLAVYLMHPDQQDTLRSEIAADMKSARRGTFITQEMSQLSCDVLKMVNLMQEAVECYRTIALP